MFPDGKDVILRIHNSDISTATVFTVKDPNGVAHVFTEGERVIFDGVTANNRATAKDITIFQDANGGATYNAGEEILTISFAAAGLEQAFLKGLPSLRINAAKTNTFYALGSAAGAVDIVIEARITKG